MVSIPTDELQGQIDISIDIVSVLYVSHNFKVAEQKEEKITMTWKPYPIYPDYEVSDEGQVRRIKDGKLLKQYPQKSGYVAVFINTGRGHKPMPVHTIVAETFLHRLPHQDRVDHINTIRSDNRVANLQWADAKENANNPTTRVNMSKARHKNREHF